MCKCLSTQSGVGVNFGLASLEFSHLASINTPAGRRREENAQGSGGVLGEGGGLRLPLSASAIFLLWDLSPAG